MQNEDIIVREENGKRNIYYKGRCVYTAYIDKENDVVIMQWHKEQWEKAMFGITSKD